MTPKKPTKAPRISAQRAPKTPTSPPKLLARRKKHYEENHERLKASAKVRYDAQDPYEKALRRFRKDACPPIPGPGTTRATNARSAALARAYCSWSDIDEVVRTYLACGVMNNLGMGHFVVDHTIPLLSPMVSGLHVHHNLRVVSQRENRVKSNQVWPQMPDVNWGTIDLLMGRL